jgi:peptidoglycan hydrolase-like protein with peptidoglycan-binding domain
VKSQISRALAVVVIAAGIALPAVAGAAPAPEELACISYRANAQYPLRLCDKGVAVKVLQLGLRIIEPNLTIDGYLGPNTHRAVLKFQQHFGLEVDGIVGPVTWKAVTWRSVTGSDANRNGRIDPAEVTFAPAASRPPSSSETCHRYRYNRAYPLRMCDKGPAVRVAQAFLSGWAPFSNLDIDGYFGPHTNRAVRSYQEQVGLEVDGLIGGRTWPRLTTGFRCGTDIDRNGIIDPDEITADPSGFANTERFLEACGSPP